MAFKSLMVELIPIEVIFPMALIKCPDCGKELSDQAKFCVNCGRPLVEESGESKDILSKDAVIGYRMQTGLAAPIVWFVIGNSVALSVIFAGLIVGGSLTILITFLVGVLFSVATLPLVFELINRIKNNVTKTDVIIYHSDKDEFEINNLNDKPYFIKRTSVYKIKVAPVSVIVYQNDKGVMVKRKVAYIGNAKFLKSVIIKYIKK